MIKDHTDIHREIERARQAVRQFDVIAAPTTAAEALTRALLRKALINSLSESVADLCRKNLGNVPGNLDLARLCAVESI